MSEPQHVSQWVIYDHPSDFPDYFIAREWWIMAGRIDPSPVTVYKDEYLENCRTFVQTVIGPGAVRFPRAFDDDPTIVESWM